MPPAGNGNGFASDDDRFWTWFRIDRLRFGWHRVTDIKLGGTGPLPIESEAIALFPRVAQALLHFSDTVVVAQVAALLWLLSRDVQRCR